VPYKKPIAPKEWRGLIAKKCAGDKEAREELIERSDGLVPKVVGDFLKNRPQFERLKEDMLLEGMRALVEAVDGLRPAIDKPVLYLCTAIQNGTQATVDKLAYPCAVSSRKEKECHKKGLPYDKPEAEYIADMDAHFVNEKDNNSAGELRDEIHACAEGEDVELKRDMLAYLEAGYTYDEIAETLGKPKSTIHHWKEQIERRFIEKTGSRWLKDTDANYALAT
jgi:RNA polymerase sigma factor (sigma-70 family)